MILIHIYWWLMLLIIATWEAEIRIATQSQSGQIVYKILSQKNNNNNKNFRT
jgi:hypothetical protein